MLRELHRWEQEPDVLAACEKLIQVGTGTCSTPGWGGCRVVLGCCGEGSGGPAGCGTSVTFLEKVLIGDEPGPGMENLLEVSIPEEVEQQLQRLDREEEERWQQEREEQRQEQEQDKEQEQDEAQEQDQEPWR